MKRAIIAARAIVNVDANLTGPAFVPLG